MAEPVQHLALIFTVDCVAAALWQRVGERTTIIAQSDFVPLESTNLPAVNTALDSALDQLGEAGLAVKDCLFCLPNAWTNPEGLRADKKSLLKAITDDLVLKPLGFVVYSDALAAEDKERTGQAFSGLVIYPSDLVLQADAYQKGELLQGEELGRSRLESDIAELLARFKHKPQRILLVEGTNSEDTARLSAILKEQAGVNPESITRNELLRAAVVAGGTEVIPPEQLPLPQPADTEEDIAFAPPAFLINRSEETAPSDLEAATAAPETPRRSRPPFRWPKLKLPPLRLPPRGRWPILAASAGVIVLIGGLWLLLRNSYMAEVAIIVKSESFEVEETFSLVTDEAELSGASVSALRATPITESVSLDKEAPTTGTKIIGDKAAGTVTIYNRTSQPKSLPAGTKLTSGKLTFTLDSEASVSAVTSEYAPGQLDAKITATVIGPESNLPKDTEFRIANFDTSSYVAKNKSALTGGSSREIQAVAAKDIDQAKKDLLGAAATQLTEKFAALSTEEEPVLFTGVTKITEEKASAKIGDEAKFVNVTLTVEGTGARINKADAVAAAQRLFMLPKGFTLQEETVEIEPLEVIQEKTGLRLRAKLRARGVPVISASEISQSLAGLYAPRAQTLLAENPKIAQAEVSIRPAWAATFFNRVPADTERIVISIRLEGAP